VIGSLGDNYLTKSGYGENYSMALFKQRQMDESGVRERIYRAPTPRERERWHALWLLAGAGRRPRRPTPWSGTPTPSATGWSTSAKLAQGASPLSRREVPPALIVEQQAPLKAAVPGPPQEAGLELANWNWKVVREFIQQHIGFWLNRSSCLNYLNRLRFVVKRPKKRLLKAKAADREAFVAFYATLRLEAQARGAKIFFVDEAHFRAGADFRRDLTGRGAPWGAPNSLANVILAGINRL